MDVPQEERDYVLPNAKNFPDLLTTEDVFAPATPIRGHERVRGRGQGPAAPRRR